MALCLLYHLPPDVWVRDTVTYLILEGSDAGPGPAFALARWVIHGLCPLPLALMLSLKALSWTLALAFHWSWEKC